MLFLIIYSISNNVGKKTFPFKNTISHSLSFTSEIQLHIRCWRENVLIEEVSYEQWRNEREYKLLRVLVYQYFAALCLVLHT